MSGKNTPSTCVLRKRGWYCARSNLHPGPCALWPRWWNRTPKANLVRDRRLGLRR